jgi:phospholipid/cholesterol/gamma-HCH transport system ATP-binding protein
MQDTSLPDPAIEFRNVSLSFEDKPALTDVSFRLERGEMILLTGASGSGKSVLLHLAMGLIKPDEGHIFVEGREIENLDESDLLAVRGGAMGMVFQEDSLFTGMSVYDNVAYRLEEHGWDEATIEKSVLEVLRFVGLEGEEETFPGELSGGMKRRVEIARALIGWPSIMLFDEATMGLDPIVALQVLELVVRARDLNNVSSLYVTKKLYEIPYLATYRAAKNSNGDIEVKEASKNNLAQTRVMLLDSGGLVFSGSVDEFQRSDLPVIKHLAASDPHNHDADPYFADPWDKERKPREEIP